MGWAFRKMDFIFFIKIYTRVCLPVGFFLNFLAIWLILTKTPKEMVIHNRILIQTCIFDILYLTQQTTGTPILARFDDTFIGLFYGYFAADFYNIFGPFGLSILTCIDSLLVGFDIMLIIFQFVYRYFLLNRQSCINSNTQIGLCRYLQLLILPIFLYISITSIILVNFRSSILDCRPEDIQYLDAMNMIGESCFVIVDEKLNLIFRYLWAWSIFCMALFFSIIIFLRWRIIRFVNAHSGFSENTRRLNKQLTRTLTLMAAYPFLSFCSLVLLAIFLFLTRIGIDNRWQVKQLQIGSVIVNSTPLVNPVITILTNTPYRTAIARIMRRKTQQQIVPT